MNYLKGFEGKRICLDINGHQVNAVLSIRYEEENDVDFSYWDVKDAEQAKNDLSANKVKHVYIQVSIFAEGLEGLSDTLQFVRPCEIEKDILQSVEIFGMIDNAKQDVIKQILDSAVKFQKYLTEVV